MQKKSILDIVATVLALAESGKDSIYRELMPKRAGVERLLFGGKTEKYELDEPLIAIPVDDEVFFPDTKVTIDLDDEWLIEAARTAHDEHSVVVVFTDEKSDDDHRMSYTTDVVAGKVGIFGFINAVKTNSDGTATAFFMAANQAEIRDVMPDPDRLFVYANVLIPKLIPQITQEEHIITEAINDVYRALLQFLPEESRRQIEEMLSTFNEATMRSLSFMMQNSSLTTRESLDLLSIDDLSQRRIKFLTLLQTKLQLFQLRQSIHARTFEEISQRQKDEFLRSQMRNIQDELTDGLDPEVAALNEKAETKEWNEETREAYEKELKRLLRYPPNSPDYALQYSYLETFLSLPWQHCDRAEFELEDVERVLERDHYGLKKVKERILEQMAVVKLRNDMKSPILCLYGPPGVGKTSLGKSIAEAMGRKYMRVALGGVHDEAEIRGHRRTYLGSMPGRIISALEKCGTSDPVLVLDEIDKMGADYKGDPSTALLEVLDPEQNCKFHDNYIDHDYDLSHVLFIATANDISGISGPLLDRMEIIPIDGYVEQEKVEIARRHLVPKNLREHGFEENEMTFDDGALLTIIDKYTRESGVRSLEKKIAAVIRKQACLKASHKEFPAVITKEIVEEYLGPQQVFRDEYENNETAGVVTGLAWTQVGGEVLFIESSVAPGKDFKLNISGNLGNVMKESAEIAMSYIRKHAGEIGIESKLLNNAHVHMHVPEGAVRKDGPSAGITILTSFASAFTKRRVRERLAMTGELTLTGKVLPVGGIREKVLAAKRAGISTVMLSRKNEKDIKEIPSEFLEGMEFHFVDSAEEVLDFALLDEPALR